MSRLRDLGEFGLIDSIAQMAGLPAPELATAIGDDCAVLDVGADRRLLLTTDAALEGRHFHLQWMSHFEIGQRTVAAAISDIAAMGGRPFACFCTAMIPEAAGSQQALDLMRGVAETARRYGAPLSGGDTIAAFDRLALDLVVLGWANTPWLRSGARAGDKLVVTGRLGEAAAALKLAQRDPELLHEPRFAGLRKRMVDPVPRLQEAALLATTDSVHAAIDLSDGLCQDAGHIAARSGVRLEMQLPQLPVSELCWPAQQVAPEEPALWAATGGEEYELLLAVEPQSVAHLADLLERDGLQPLTRIGDVVPGEGVAFLDEDGVEVTFERGGWDHFG